jgi:hypothetical protein
MKYRFNVLYWFLVVCIYLLNFTSDPGFADSLYFEAGEPSSENGDTLFIPSDSSGGDVTIYIKVQNDEPVSAFTVPLIDKCSCAYFNPAKNNGGTSPICFEGSRVENFTMLSLNLDLCPPQLLYGVFSFSSPLLQGNGIFAKMIYTIPPEVSEICTCICLDTLFFPPGNTLKFVDTLAEGIVPVFEEKCFRVAVGNQTEIPEIDSESRFHFDLKQNYPNPFNSHTAISFTIHDKRSTENSPLHINLSIYNILGQKVKTLMHQKYYPGEYLVFWDGRDEKKREVSSGIYIYKLSFDDLVIYKKMVLLR